MDSRRAKKISALTSIGVLVGCIVLFVGHGCGIVGDAKNAGIDLTVVGNAGVDEIQIFPNTKTVATAYSKQFLDNMISCTGQQIESARTTGEYEGRKGSLSEFGYATKATPPMLMAIAAIAGEVCSDVIDAEGSGSRARVLFVGMSLDGSGGTNSSEVSDAIQRIALSCWNRRATNEEVGLLQQMVGEGNLMSNGRDAALGLCTAMLGSYESYEM